MSNVPTALSQGDTIQAQISGEISGQVAVGKGISQSQTQETQAAVTEAELTELRNEFATLRVKIEAEAPPEKKAAALERVQELEEAIVTEEPDLTTMQYVRSWFVKNIPKLAGAVTTVVIHPIVGRIVESAGELTAAELRRRFGHDG